MTVTREFSRQFIGFGQGQKRSILNTDELKDKRVTGIFFGCRPWVNAGPDGEPVLFAPDLASLSVTLVDPNNNVKFDELPFNYLTVGLPFGNAGAVQGKYWAPLPIHGVFDFSRSFFIARTSTLFDVTIIMIVKYEN